jgi:hypothetical protein
VVDGLPAHKKGNVREYMQSTKGKLSMHVLPGYAHNLNPDELNRPGFSGGSNL